MSSIKGVLRNHLRERPFDFYVACLIFFAGLLSIVSDAWPESIQRPLAFILITAISLYYMIASAIVILSLSLNRKKHPVFALMGEMYGWMFISAASIATTLLYLGFLVNGAPQSWGLWIILVLIWLGLAISSGVRFLDLSSVYRSLKK